MPVQVNVLHASRNKAMRAPKGDICLSSCANCGHMFNASFNPDFISYAPNYENSLHFSPRFQRYADRLAERLVRRYRMRGRSIIEIGCGRGDFLKLLCHKGGNRGTGFDPGYPGGSEAHGVDNGELTFVRDYYSEKFAGYRANLICCRQTLEHIARPTDFLRMLRRMVGDDHATVLVFDVPNVLFIVRKGAIWDIIYEHCSYFSRNSLAYAFAAAGFAVQALTTGFGGQYLVAEAKPGADLDDDDGLGAVDGQALAPEITSFAVRYQEKVETWQRRFEKLARSHRRAIVWGAGSKGVTFLNTLRIGDQVEYAVDVNPRKHNMYVAGTGQRIVAPEFLRDYRPDLIVVMNRIYLSEIRQFADRLELSARMVCA